MMTLAPRFWRVRVLNLIGQILDLSSGHLDLSVPLNSEKKVHCSPDNIFHKARSKNDENSLGDPVTGWVVANWLWGIG